SGAEPRPKVGCPGTLRSSRAWPRRQPQRTRWRPFSRRCAPFLATSGATASAPGAGLPPAAGSASASRPSQLGEAALGARLRLGALQLAVAGRRGGGEAVEQPPAGRRDLLGGAEEGLLVGLRGAVGAGDLAHELEGCGVDLLVGRGGIEVEEDADVSAHDRASRRWSQGHFRTSVRTGD